jgi:predicted transcriptional regulator
MSKSLSAEVMQFIVLHVASVELLEVLVLMHSEKARDWSAEDIDQRIRSNPASIEKRLQRLRDLGLLRATEAGKYQFMPRDVQLEGIANSVVQAYQSRRVEVTELIYTKPMKEIMNFANAFKIGGKKSDG